MAGTIVVDRIESDASYASNINVASQITFSNTVNFGITSVAPVAGFYSPSTNNVAFTTASTERMRISPSGNVLIGTTTTQTGAILAVTGGIQGTITSGTTVASTSGTTIDFTAIPSWVKRITVMFSGVSTNGASDYLVQIGAGSVASTGYLGTSGRLTTGVVMANYTTGFGINNGAGAASYTCNGLMTITLLNSATGLWCASGVVGNSASNDTSVTGASKTLSGTLDRVRITTTNGTDTFDAGSINIMYEG